MAKVNRESKRDAASRNRIIAYYIYWSSMYILQELMDGLRARAHVRAKLFVKIAGLRKKVILVTIFHMLAVIRL